MSRQNNNDQDDKQSLWFHLGLGGFKGGGHGETGVRAAFILIVFSILVLSSSCSVCILCGERPPKLPPEAVWTFAQAARSR